MWKLIISILFINVIVIQADELADLKALVQELQKNEISLSNRVHSLEIEQDNDSNACGNDWISFSNTKCFKVLGIRGTEAVAKNKCSQLDSSSTLITIASKSEQDYLSKYLEKYQSTSDGVWIGLELVNNVFEWIDRNNVVYENWGQNAIKDGKNKCTRMSLTNSELGKWTDDDCERMYLIVCQKLQSTKTVLAELIQNLTKHIDRLDSTINENRKQIDSLKASSIPIGFIYTQYPNQSSPKDLFPHQWWYDVTSQYSGLFFRAFGGGSEEFGAIQASNQSWISSVQTYSCDSNLIYNNFVGYSHQLPDKGWSERLVGKHFNTGLYFYTTEAEVRPKNTAIKIWKRVK